MSKRILCVLVAVAGLVAAAGCGGGKYRPPTEDATRAMKPAAVSAPADRG